MVRESVLHHLGQELACGFGNGRPRPKNSSHPKLKEPRIVAFGNDAAHHYQNIGTAHGSERIEKLRHQGFMACREGADADPMHVVFDGLSRGLLGRLKQWPQIHIKSHVRKTAGHHFGAAVVAVLPHFGNQNTGAAPLVLREGVR